MPKILNAFVEKALKEGPRIIEGNLGYSVKRIIGRGGMGVVFEAENSDGEKHAVKVSMKPEVGFQKRKLTEKEKHLASLLESEGEFQKMLSNHPNIVKLYGSYDYGNCVVLDMEMCEKTLDDWLKDGRGHYVKQTEDEFRMIARTLTSTIAYVHSFHVSHRDIKSCNVLLRKNGNGDDVLKLGDFGLAKSTSDGNMLKTRVGTSCFRAPEVAFGSMNEYTNKCDIWSLGVMYFLILTARLPFGEENTLLTFYEDPSKVGVKLPADCPVSLSCRHFVECHLRRKDSDRPSAEQLMHHPFLLPSLRLYKMTSVADFSKSIDRNINLGDIYFDKAKQAGKGQSVNISWGEIADYCGVSDVKDLIFVTEVGECFRENDIIDLSKQEDRAALMIPSSLSVLKDILLQEEEKKVEFSSLEDFLKCREYVMFLTGNCQFLDVHRKAILTSGMTHKLFNELQGKVLLKCEEFPRVILRTPVYEVCRNLDCLIDEIKHEEDEIKSIKLSADSEADAVKWDLKKFVSSTKQAVGFGVKAMRELFGHLQRTIEMVITVAEYKKLLKKALETSDAKEVFPELLSLLKKSEYLKIDDEDMKRLEKYVGIETSEPGGDDEFQFHRHHEMMLLKQLEFLEDDCKRLQDECDELNRGIETDAKKADVMFKYYEARISELRLQLKELGISTE